MEKTRPKVYRCDSRSAAITAMGFEDSDSKDCDPIDSDSQTKILTPRT